MDKGNYSRIGSFAELVNEQDCILCYMKVEI